MSENIAMMFCELPEGKYNVKTKLGNIEVESVWANERSYFRTVSIKINGKLYTEIIYSAVDYFHLWENVFHENNGIPYKLKHEILSENSSEIEYRDKSDTEFVISEKYIASKNNNNKTYNVINGRIINNESNKNILFSYDLNNEEKLLHIKKNTKNTSTQENDFVTIKGDYKKVISKYNELINVINSNANNLINNDETLCELSELVNSYTFPTIDLEELEKLDKEIDKYVKIYKEYAPKLNHYHTEAMLQKLFEVALILSIKYPPKTIDNEEKESNGNKIFDLSKFKNK